MNMINIAILGFGVVGGGVYEVIKQNGLPVTVRHILDKRTFPGHDLENAAGCAQSRKIRCHKQ